MSPCFYVVRRHTMVLLTTSILALSCFDTGKAMEGAVSKRLQWNKETLSGAYAAAGHTNSAWDEAARRALDEFATLRATQPPDMEPLRKVVVRHCQEAMRAKCTDPMIGYLHVRFDVGYSNVTAAEYAEALGRAADALRTSKYPPIRKLYASVRASEQFQSMGTNMAMQMYHHRRGALRFVTNVVADPNVPVEEIDEVFHQVKGLLSRNNQQYEAFYKSVEGPLFRNWGNDYRPWLFKGRHYRGYAWEARGGGYADKVTETGWELFRERLAIAAEALEKAWKLNSTDARVPTEMIEVIVGQQKSRDTMELWFNRAMKLNTNNYDACRFKQRYLMPIWYGSEEEMLKFGRACVNSTEWGGHVPLNLVDAHDWIAKRPEHRNSKQYWKNPEVWADVKRAYEKFFKLNPDHTGWRHNYARHAYWCEQWNDFNRQLPLLGPINYEFFGSKAEFEKMVTEAKRRSSRGEAEDVKKPE
jgi:hypothetical protein